MMKILVTGGAGFIGTHLVNKLIRSGHTVRVLDNLSPQIHGENAGVPGWASELGVEFLHGSVTDRDTCARALDGMDAVVHLAAETGTGQSMYQIARYYEVNVQGTANLLDVLANGDHSVRRVLLASSRSVYGEGAFCCPACSGGPEGKRHYPDMRPPAALAARQWDPLCPDCGAALAPVPTREDDRIAPASIYAASKYAQEDLVRVAGTALGVGYAIFRLQNVYGEGQSLKNPYTGILSIFSTRVRLGLTLPIFEDGAESRDFVHVDDVVNAFVAGLEADEPLNDVVNVGTGEPTSVQEVAEGLCRALGAPEETKVTGQFRVGDIRHNFADVSKLKARLGYVPTVGLGDGLSRFVAWVATQPVPQDMLEAANEELRRRKLMG